MALITFFLADELKKRGVEINPPDKAVRIALLHDIGGGEDNRYPPPAGPQVRGQVRSGKKGR
ncbi:hypothetical protein [Thermococcus sp. JCM 11816]|uniref:hypothetical protein n=1 Tax=Thermococcus sp. (strain JCM 11816 / KS-1) TaxID=1295125 RepID=UPI000AD19528